VSYLREFAKRIPEASANGRIAEFREQAIGSRLWRIASRLGAGVSEANPHRSLIISIIVITLAKQPIHRGQMMQ